MPQCIRTMQLLHTAPTLRAALDPEERLALLLAALCHDLDHDGHSNAYHGASGQRRMDWDRGKCPG
jgi:hypothetical protein